MSTTIQELARLALEGYDDSADELDKMDARTAELHSTYLLAVQDESAAKAADPNYRFDPMATPLDEPQAPEVVAAFKAYHVRLKELAVQS